MRLSCRSKSRLVMTSPAGQEPADARNILENFLTCLEPVVTFNDDCLRSVPDERMVEKVECCVRDRMRVRISKQRPGRSAILDRDPAGHMNFLNEAARKVVEEDSGIKVMILGVQVDVLHVE